MMLSLYRQTILPTLSLFSSLSTLLCCALPALLVTFGMGAVLAGVISYMPWLSVVSEHKIIVFVIAGILLMIATYIQLQSGEDSCPVDVMQRQACARLKKISWIVLCFSIAVYLLGFFFAFVAVHIFY